MSGAAQSYAPVTTEVAIADVIGKDKYDVGLRPRRDVRILRPCVISDIVAHLAPPQ